MDAAVKADIDKIFDRTLKFLEHNRKLLVDTSKELLERETLDEPDLQAVAKKVKALTTPKPA